MSPVIKAPPRSRRKSPERELFSVNVLTQKVRLPAGKMTALWVRELLSLTLAGNRELARILKAYRKQLCLDAILPRNLYDQWLSRRVHGQDLPSDLTDQRRRSQWRQKLEQGADSAEHIVLRVYAAEVLKPQSKGHARHQLLAVAYHLGRKWLHLQLLDIRESYLDRDHEKKRDEHARMLTRGQWQGLAHALKERAETEGSDPETMFCIHLPQGSAIHDLLQTHSVRVVEDMPAIPPGVIEITYRMKRSKRDPLKQVSFAPILGKPTKDQQLGDVTMATLPELKGLTHVEKDLLIDTLWRKITILRQHLAAHVPGKPPA